MTTEVITRKPPVHRRPVFFIWRIPQFRVRQIGGPSREAQLSTNTWKLAVTVDREE